MVKEIKYTGFTASPSDYECPDGDLAAVLNVVPEEGSLSPVLPPLQLFQLTDGRILRFVHETAYIKNYIVTHGNVVEWTPGKNSIGEPVTPGSTFNILKDFSGTNIRNINAIGNTLLVICDDGTHYFFWKGYDFVETVGGTDYLGYTYLSTHMPEIDMSFGLQFYREMKVVRDVIGYDFIEALQDNGDDYSVIAIADRLRDGETGMTDYEFVNETVMSETPKFLAEITDKGYFVMPFLVRYAYRLYDGSLTMHSAPVLMLPNFNVAPMCYLGWSDTGDPYLDVKSGLRWVFCAFRCSLDYAVSRNVEKLKLWGDIIKSVDVFVSSPIYTHDQNGKIGRKLININDNNNMLHTISRAALPLNTEERYYEDHQFFDGSTNRAGIELPVRYDNQLNDGIHGNNLFYFLKDIKIDDLSSDRTVIKIDKGYLSTLAMHEVLTDDYQTHDTLYPSSSHSYNARLVFSGIRKQFFEGFDAQSLFCFTNSGDIDNRCIVDIYYYIKYQEHECIVKSQFANQVFSTSSKFLYLFYPGSYAYKAVIKIETLGSASSIRYYEVPLSPHPKLNGTYWFDGLDSDITDGTHDYTGSIPSVSPVSNRIVDFPNKVYVSEVNNPFYFPATGVISVGTGRVMSISSAAKALSQGQFGQFPLYAFTDEGVWALEISKTGTISAVQPFTRDVCINADSITQLDSSVLFATDRGIMLISGSTSTCISDLIDYSQTFQVTSLPQSDKLLAFVGYQHSDLSYVTFHEFIKGCRMLYSYNRQYIIAFNRSYPYAYVYSIKSKSWGMIPSTIAYTIPSYPEAIAQLEDGTIVDYSAEGTLTTDADGNFTGIKGMLITRPLKLDAPDVLKTVDTVIQRGNFQRGHIKTAIYGSRDLINWFVVWTSVDHYLRGFRGTPYKYFRLVLLCDLDPTESVYGCTIQYTPRFTNRLR